MADRQSLLPLFQRLLKRTGGFYLLISVVIVQIATNLLSQPAIVLIQSNANLTGNNLAASVRTAAFLSILSNLILLFVAYRLSRNAFRRLEAWRRSNTLPVLAAQEKSAWHEITRLPWRYGLWGLASSFLVVALPLMAYESFILHLTSDQIIYTLMGGFIAILMIISASAIGIEWLFQPAREILLPTDFETQISDVLAIRIFWKLQIFIIAMVTTGIVTLAPLGYRKIVQVVEGLEPAQALREYQLQSLFIAFVILLIAAALTALIANLFSAPFSQLVDTFKKVEQGQLNQRARVIATDEAGELEVYFNHMITRLEGLQTTLENQVAERTAQLAAVIEVGRAASAILDPDELIEKVVNLITDRFGHYYSAIFAMDSTGKWAELKNATGEAGRVLRESRHRLAVDGKSMVGTAISQKEARIALDVGLEPVRFNNPLLPYTRSEIALPLVVGETILGALDVQSTRESAFKQEDIETLQSMANQVAVALENARLFQETNQRLLELQNTQRQYLHEAWTSITANERLEYGVGDETLSTTESAMNVPLALRDEVIGQISLSGDEEWSPEERAWVEAVATQAAIALENARLMEQNRKQAGIERTVAEITTRVWSADTIDGILQTAAKEIGRALNLSEATIELNTEDQGGADNE
jgi:GAF domain-containing protein/HAMP domain-containing protein